MPVAECAGTGSTPVAPDRRCGPRVRPPSSSAGRAAPVGDQGESNDGVVDPLVPPSSLRASRVATCGTLDRRAAAPVAALAGQVRIHHPDAARLRRIVMQRRIGEAGEGARRRATLPAIASLRQLVVPREQSTASVARSARRRPTIRRAGDSRVAASAIRRSGRLHARNSMPPDGKRPSWGRTSARPPADTPNQRASVAAYWSTEVRREQPALADVVGAVVGDRRRRAVDAAAAHRAADHEVVRAPAMVGAVAVGGQRAAEVARR